MLLEMYLNFLRKSFSLALNFQINRINLILLLYNIFRLVNEAVPRLTFVFKSYIRYNQTEWHKILVTVIYTSRAQEQLTSKPGFSSISATRAAPLL